jgi:hypothetical protein
MRRRLRTVSLAAADAGGRVLVKLPGLLALVCAVAGVFLLWGPGWAFLAAVPFLILIDRSH